MKHIVLHGAFYGDNFGDTLLLKLCCEKVLESGAIPVVSNVCDATFRQLPKKCLRLGFNVKFHQCDALIYCGGGYFGEQPINRFRWNLGFIKRHMLIGLRSILRRKPILVVGVGVGPLSLLINRLFLRCLCSVSQQFCVRDSESGKYLKNIGCPDDKPIVAADLALSLNLDNYKGFALEENLPPYIVLHLGAPSALSSEQDAVNRGVMRFVDSNPDMFFVLACDKKAESQIQFCNEFADHIGADRSRIVPYTGVSDLLRVIADCKMVVTTKLHVGIVASGFGIRSVAFANHPKTPRFYRQLDAEKFCIMKSAANVESVFELLTKAAGSGNPSSERLREMKALSNAALDLISEFIQSIQEQ